MARYRGPKNKLARREATDLGLKTVGSAAHTQLLRRIKIIPGQHSVKGRRKTSDYGVQLREKQKVKRIYGLLEKQFRKYFDTATRDKANTGAALLTLLERRLDNVLYRLKLAPTRTAARQFVGHGHAIVDGKKVTIPSYMVKPGSVVTLKEKFLGTPLLKKLLEEKDIQVPAWLVRKGPVGKIERMPQRDDVAEDIDEQLIIEFYSR
jgi:small subunit ribosomal protein S4